MAVAAIGVLALLGWVLDAPGLTRWNTGTVPMAPSTAVLSILFGVALSLCAQGAPRRGPLLLVTVLAWVGVAAALVLFVLRLLGVYSAAELLGLRIGGTVGRAPIGYISPITACCFLLASGALLISLSPGARGTWRGWFAGSVGGLIAVTGFVILLSSAFGAPLLSGIVLIPPALNTSLILLIMGLALLMFAGRPTGDPRVSPHGVREGRLVFVAGFTGFAVSTIIGGYAYYRQAESEVRSETEHELNVVAQLKVSEVSAWRKERLGDASVLLHNAFLSASLGRLLQRPDDAANSRRVDEWLGSYHVYGQFDRTFLIDAHGATRLSLPAPSEPPSSTISRQAVEVLRTGQLAFLDFYLDERDRRVHLAMLIPILDEAGTSQPIAVLVLRIDPEPFLHEFIERWPTTSATAETLLVRRDGSDALYLTSLRFDPNAALRRRSSLENTRELGVKAALGQTGIVEGVDYRGAPAIGVLRSIPDSPWHLVTRMDVAEFHAVLWERLWIIAAFGGVLLFGAGSGLGLVWRGERARSYREQVALAEALRVSEERLRLALGAASQGLWDLNVQTGDVAVSPEYATMLGHDPVEFHETSTGWIERLHPDDRERVTAAHRDCIAGRRDEYRVEYRQRTKSGDWTWVLSQGKLVSHTADGQPLRMLGTHTDITRRKAGEEALRQSEARYRRILETAQEGVWTIDAENRTTFVNPKMAELLGYTVEEMLGASPFDFMDEDARAIAAAGVGRQRAGAAERLEFRFRRKDGSAIWTLVNAHAMMSDAGDYVGALGMVSDITDVKLASDRLRLQSAALDAAANAIVIMDVPGSIVWVNPAFTTLTGYSPDEAIGRNPRDLDWSGVHDATFCKDVWDTILAGHVWRGEVMSRRKDGSRYVEEQTITPLKNPGGQITHFIAIKRDLTDQKQLQEQFLQAQKMDAIGQLASGVAHDFNNMLTAILGYTEFLLQGLETEEQRADAEEIIKAGNRAAALTKQLLAFSRKQVLQTAIVEMNALVTDVTHLLGRMIGEHIELSTVLAQDLPFVRVDAGQIEQMLINLAVNSRDAMPDGGRLTIETASVELDGTVAFLRGPARPGRYVRLTIADTGTGMTEDTRRRALDPFFTTKEPGKGTGLGLSTVYGIVKQSDGYLRIDSEFGRGTTFTVYLPVAEAESADLAAAAPGRKPAGGAETVLLVEDEEAVRLLVRTILERTGYLVLAAANPAEAELAFDEHRAPIDILLTDVVMPGGTGVDLYHRLEAKQPGLRAVFMSGYVDAGAADQVGLVPNASFLQKPFTADGIVRSLRVALDR